MLRRERHHAQGQSNLDFRSSKEFKGDDFTGTKSKFEALPAVKKQTLNEVLKQRESRTVQNPFNETQSLYDTNGKLQKDKIKVGYPRKTFLEDKEKMGLAFTGESELIYNVHFDQILTSRSKSTRKKTTKEDNNKVTKHDENANATQETQLIGLEKYTLETLKNKVDLEKVREVRRALRRRYANRKNIQKIYNSWDENHAGKLDFQNVYNMIHRLGLNMNVDEAKILVASADKDGDNCLSLDEFLDLVFNKDDALNVNFKTLTKGTDGVLDKDDIKDDNLMARLAEDAKRGREIRHLNQMNLLLKNRLNDLATNFLNDDAGKSGTTNYEKFETAIKKLGINENILTEKDIKEMFEKNKIDEHSLNYKQFVEKLKHFEFVHENAYREFKEEKPKPKRVSTIDMIKESLENNAKEAEPEVLDCREAPFHQLKDYFTKNRKVSRALIRFFPNQDSLKEYISSEMKLEKNNIEDHHITKNEVKNFVTTLFQNFDKVNLSKKDYEGFFSSILYNKHDQTTFKEIFQSIYNEGDAAYIDKISMKKNGPAPDLKIATSLEFASEDKKGPNFDGLYHSATFTRSKEFHWTSQGFIKQKNLEGVLKTLDEKLFMSTTKAFDVYKSFDTDKDGFISHNDIIKRMDETKLLSKDEVPILLNYLDPENKGYVNFAEFSKKVRPNVLNQDEKGKQLSLPYVVPTKEITQKLTTYASTTKHSNLFNRTLESLEPDARATRYGSSPAWKNTFATFQPDSTSPMFIAENERLNRHPMMKTLFQLEEKEKKNMTQLSRVASIKNHRDYFENKIVVDYEQREAREQGKIFAKSLAQNLYEHKAKLRNPVF